MNYSTFSIAKPDFDVETSKSQEFGTKTKDNEILSYADELLVPSESVFDFPSSTPSSYNITSGSGQKTYGKGRTILGQDIDSVCLDPIAPIVPSLDMEIDDNDVSDDNLVCKFKIYYLIIISFIPYIRTILFISTRYRHLGDIN